ncbi:unnamed protein product [Rhizoctonia solani]|uniref:Uncharacterized protein n=1 Tax=Rhizoctonia solani TaxID=456999 RepID=A0A8H3HB69_9AGAM|nr:unnamed protein product [Rhizoctonia solani]
MVSSGWEPRQGFPRTHGPTKCLLSNSLFAWLHSFRSYPMDKVFCTPELVRGICENVALVDTIHLALTCRDIFTRAIPIVWTHVSGVSQLLVLIEGATYEKPLEDEWGPIGDAIIHLPDNLEDLPQSRFGFYAPFVTSLEVYNNRYQGLSVPLLESFALFAFTRAPLPNLKRLSISSGLSSSTKYYSLWVDIFSCSSLEEVRIPSTTSVKRPSIPYTMASHITNALNQHCPEIQILQLYWDDNPSDSFTPHGFPQIHGDPINITKSSMDESLLRYTSLTSISGSMYLLKHSTLIILGSLPELQCLDIHFPDYVPNIPDPDHYILPPDSFPKLNQLLLSNVRESVATSIWKIPAIVARLRSVNIEFEERTGVLYQDVPDSEIFIPLLCTQSPHIHELVLEFDPNIRPLTSDFTEDAFNAISKLELTRLEVFHAYMSKDTLWERLIYTWPTLTVLRWPEHHVKLSKLSLFAEHLPNLEELAVWIDISGPFGELDEKSIKVSQHRLRILESGFHDLGRFGGSFAYKIYRYLRTLIPNAKLKARANSNIISYKDVNVDCTCAAAINVMEELLAFQRHHALDESIEKQFEMLWTTVYKKAKEIRFGELRQLLLSHAANGLPWILDQCQMNQSQDGFT